MSIITERNQRKSTNDFSRHMYCMMTGRYTAVEFSVRNLECLYQFKILESPVYGMGFLVQEGSAIMKHLNVGDVVDMRYYPVNQDAEIESFRTEIRHIAKDYNGRFRGHYLVGLSIVDA